MPLYTEAKRSFFQEMIKLGFPLSDVQETFEATDLANVSVLGFSKSRFPLSMTTTYRVFCSNYNIRPRPEVERKIKAIGYSVFSKHPPLLNHAAQVLAQLQPSYKLILATKGDHDVQQLRIEKSGLVSYFHNIFILDEKNTQCIRKIVEHCQLDLEKSWVVGNSLKSDINPGLLAGLRAIWVPYSTWSYEEDMEIQSPKLFRVASLDSIIDVLKREET